MLGDAVESALKAVGVTPEQVEKWLGAPCECAERKEKLNQLDRWARRVARGKIQNAVDFLYRMLG